MEYPAFVRREGNYWLVEFPDCPGCQTFARSEKELRKAAQEALEGWLEAHLVDGQVPPQPRPRRRAPKDVRLWSVAVDPALAVSLQIRWFRQDAGLSQADLAARAGVSQQQIAKLERPGENPTIATLKRVAKALDVKLEVHLGGSATPR
jgi:predicted RNase H-like HicB family nuclease/DNA-binding XRE family transcriptional regulator